MWFTLAMFGAFGALFAYQGALGTAGHIVRFMAVGGTLLLPVALTRWFFPKTDRAAAIILAVNSLLPDRHDLLHDLRQRL